MKKKLLILLLILGCFSGMWAGDSQGIAADGLQNALSIYLKDGKVTSFTFARKPVVTYEGNELVLTTTETQVSFPLYLVQKVVPDVNVSSPNAIDETSVATKPAFAFRGGTLTVSGGKPGAPIFIYDLQGILVLQQRLDINGCATISTHQLGSNVYVLKASHITFKFRKS